MTARRSFLLGLSAALVGLPAGLRAETRSATPVDLAAVLEAAGPGTVIELAGGDYGSLAMRGGGGGPQAPLVLRSADPARPARFARLGLRNVSHMVLEGLVFDYTFTAGDESRLRPFQIGACRAITLRNCLFDGDRASHDGKAAPSPTGFGLSVRDSDGVTVEGNRIRGFLRGLIVSQSRNVTVRGNEFHGLRSDGMNFAEVVSVLIEGNLLHDFERPEGTGDHPDMIQFWTNGTNSPTQDVTIRDNVLNVGQGAWTQSIFMRNEMVDAKGAGRAMFYRNIVIEDNVIVNAHPHGITVGETLGLAIRNNSVLRNARAAGEGHRPSFWTPRIRVAKTSEDVRILRNVTASVVGYEGQRGWQVDGNLLVQDEGRMQPGFYGTVFGAAALSAPERIESFAPRRGGPLDGTGIGAARLRALPLQP